MAKTNGSQSHDYYDGDVCYVGEDASATDINGELCDGGWHYTAVTDEEAKKVAVDHAKAQVKLWEKREANPVTGRFAAHGLENARQALADIQADDFHVPGEKLHLEDTEDGSESRFRLATDADTASWHDRKHQNFATFTMEDQTGEPVRVSEDEMAVIQKALREHRAQGKGGEG